MRLLKKLKQLRLRTRNRRDFIYKKMKININDIILNMYGYKKNISVPRK